MPNANTNFAWYADGAIYVAAGMHKIEISLDAAKTMVQELQEAIEDAESTPFIRFWHSLPDSEVKDRKVLYGYNFGRSAVEELFYKIKDAK